MKNTKLVVAIATITVSAVLASAGAHAQTKPLQVWQPTQHREPDPAKRVPVTPQPVSTNADAEQPMMRAPATAETYTAAEPVSTRYVEDRGGFFLGVQAGKGWVYEDVDQSAFMVNAGYRWQAGAVTLVGIEAAAGRLDDEDDANFHYGALDYASVGVNARFNFGVNNPVYGLVRAGYWSAETKGVDDRVEDTVDGGYFGVGLGVDFTRNFNISVVYTNHVYFQSYYGLDDYDISRADTLLIGAELRF